MSNNACMWYNRCEIDNNKVDEEAAKWMLKNVELLRGMRLLLLCIFDSDDLAM